MKETSYNKKEIQANSNNEDQPNMDKNFDIKNLTEY
jgi:hypothetical protein